MPMHHRVDPAPCVRLLLVDANPVAGLEMCATLESGLAGPLAVENAATGKQAAEQLRGTPYHIVLVDLSAIGDLASTAEDAIARLSRLAQGALILAISDGASISAAVAAMRAGAHDVVSRPLDGATLSTRIAELAHRHGKGRELTGGAGRTPQTGGPDGFVSVSSQMQFVYEQIERIAASPSPVFITGETGTGKGLCAAALHQRSGRAAGRFVTVDCAAVARGHLEVEIFGVARGAVTGAFEDRPGAIEQADGGTLFLDEIGDMDLSVQAKLLRFLQAGVCNRVGDARLIEVDVRVICATSRNPLQLIAERVFREDLFYRLHMLPIHLPPLRQRPADTLALAQHFLCRFAEEEHKQFAGFTPGAAELLTARDWPGNVHELQTVIRQLVVMFSGGEVSVAMLESVGRLAGTIEPMASVPFRQQPIQPLWQQEQRIIEEAIARCSGNVALAAAALELSPSTIYRKRQGWAEAEGKRGAA